MQIRPNLNQSGKHCKLHCHPTNSGLVYVALGCFVETHAIMKREGIPHQNWGDAGRESVWSTCQFPYLEAGGGFVFEVGRHGGTTLNCYAPLDEFVPVCASLWMEERFLAGNRLMALRPKKISPITSPLTDLPTMVKTRRRSAAPSQHPPHVIANRSTTRCLL